MTVNIMVDQPEGGRGRRRTIMLGATALVAPLAMFFVVGAMKGYSHAAGTPFPRFAATMTIGVLLAITTAAIFALIRGRRPPRGEGERVAAVRSRNFWLMMGAMAALGFVSAAAYLSLTTPKDGGGVHFGPLPPNAALGLAILSGVAMSAATRWFFAHADELERADNIWGAAIGANALAIVYPPWFLLWKGGWVPQPDPSAPFLLLVTVMMLAYAWRKFR